MIVKADNGLPLEPPEQLGHFLILNDAKLDAVTFGLPIWRIQIEQSVRPVVALHQLVPENVLDERASKAEMGGRQVLFYAQEIDRRDGRGRAPGLPVYLATERLRL